MNNHLLKQVEITRVLKSCPRGTAYLFDPQVVDSHELEAAFVVVLSDLQIDDYLFVYPGVAKDVRWSQFPHAGLQLVGQNDSGIELTYTGDPGESRLLLLDVVKPDRYVGLRVIADCAVDGVFALCPTQRPPSVQPSHAWTAAAGCGVLAAGIATSPDETS